MNAPAIKAGIVIDTWKLEIFTRRLQSAGYTFENKGNLTPESLVLHVMTTNPIALGEVIKSAEAECARTGAPKP